MRAVSRAIVAGCMFLVACGGNGGNGKNDVPVTPDIAPETVGGEVAGEVVADLAPEEVGPQVPDAPFGWGFAARGWKEMRGIVHLHSAYSHDGCGPDGYEDFGGPDPACLDELRAAPCATDVDFMMMTDHPGEVKHHTFEEGLQYRADEGDELVLDGQGRPFANRMTCPEGSMVEKAYFFFGTEGSKNMPIGMSGPVPMQVFDTNYGQDEPLENAQAAVAIVHELEGYAFACHTEESTISVERMIELPLDGMEIYNLHAGLMGAFNDLDTILSIDRFMTEGGPDPDLAVMLFLQPVEKDVLKFDQVTPYSPISIIAATDIHRNVEIPALCPDGPDTGLCWKFAEEYPEFANFATIGGPLPLSDGDRVDSYARSFRWFSNRALVKEDDPDLLRQAVGTGRGYAVFDVFGYPGEFDFYVAADGAAVELGEEITAPATAVAYIRTPIIEAPPWRAGQEVDYSKCQVSTRLVRASEEGSEVLIEVTGQGVYMDMELPDPGAYRVEVRVRPFHYEPLLPGVEKLAQNEFPYIYTNAIFIR